MGLGSTLAEARDRNPVHGSHLFDSSRAELWGEQASVGRQLAPWQEDLHAGGSLAILASFGGSPARWPGGSGKSWGRRANKVLSSKGWICRVWGCLSQCLFAHPILAGFARARRILIRGDGHASRDINSPPPRNAPVSLGRWMVRSVVGRRMEISP